MKLFFNPASPFVRKVRMVAVLTGSSDSVELVDVTITPVNPADAVNQNNPLGKIPTLVLDNGEALFDSRVICEYLDQTSGGRLSPEGDARWTDKRLQALADGICDAAILVRYEAAVRPEERQWDGWTDNQWLKVTRALDFLEANAASLDQADCLGNVALVCALGYLDFRFEDRAWREGRPQLAAWFAAFSDNDVYRGTAP